MFELRPNLLIRYPKKTERWFFFIDKSEKFRVTIVLRWHDTIKQNPRVEASNGVTARVRCVDRLYG